MIVRPNLSNMWGIPDNILCNLYKVFIKLSMLINISYLYIWNYHVYSVSEICKNSGSGEVCKEVVKYPKRLRLHLNP